MPFRDLEEQVLRLLSITLIFPKLVIYEELGAGLEIYLRWAAVA